MTLTRFVIGALIAGAFLISLVELGAVAGDRGRSRPSLFTEGIEAELPIAAEVDHPEVSSSPVLTR